MKILVLLQGKRKDAIQLPQMVLEALNVSDGDIIECRIEGHECILHPVQRRKTMHERFAEYDGSLCLSEDWELEPVGKEIW